MKRMPFHQGVLGIAKSRRIASNRAMMKFTGSLLFCLLFCLVGQVEAQEKIKPLKVLFLGNSITKHGPNEKIGWTGDWGMAASAEAKDYVHLVIQGLTAQTGAIPNAMVRNIAEFERQHAGYEIETKLAEAIAFQADLVILAIGENVPALATPESQAIFEGEVVKLLQAVKSERQPRIIVRSCFWANQAKDESLKKIAETTSATFVDINSLSKDEANYARSERQFDHEGVANHPGDKGMAAIAEAILAALK